MEILTEKIYQENGRDFSWLPKNFSIYNLGAGKQSYENVKSVDILPISGADIIHNLDIYPWPIETSSADLIISFQTFEHLENLGEAMVEVHRILKNHGRLIVEVPYFRHPGAFQDPTHKHFFTAKTMDYFCTINGHTPPYTNVDFKKIKSWYGWPTSSSKIKRVLKNMLYKYSDIYDSHLSLLFPAKIIVYELEAIK